MVTTDNTISLQMCEILRQCKGLLLDSILCTDTGNSVQTISMQVVILRFNDFDIELWNEEKPDIPGELKDIAKIRIHVNPDKDLQSPVGKKDKAGNFIPLDFIPFEIKKKIYGIKIYNEKIKCLNTAGIVQFELDNTCAIVISLGDIFVHIEKQNHWSEMWHVFMKKTDILNQPSEWENEEDCSYEVHPYSLLL